MCPTHDLLPACLLALLALAAAAAVAGEPASEDVDWDRARRLLERSRQSLPLSAEEQRYLDHAKQLRQRMRSRAEPGPATRATKLVPLSDLTAGQRYKEMDGGLYGQGRNAPPPTLVEAARRQSDAVVPLDGQGQPSAQGRIVLLSIGMSNTTQEFSRFKHMADADPQKSLRLVIVDGAQGAQDALRWDATADPRASAVWQTADERLSASGVTAAQVQIVWIKQALAGPGMIGPFPQHARRLEGHLVAILNQAKARYPNLRLAYLSSRIYAGYATTALNPEPYAYEGAFAVRWVIQRQMAGDAKLNWNSEQGEVTAPLALWGPYLWADGVAGRHTDDLSWQPEDFGPDGTHPSDSGRQKVAKLLLRFFKTDPTARSWFLASGEHGSGTS